MKSPAHFGESNGEPAARKPGDAFLRHSLSYTEQPARVQGATPLDPGLSYQRALLEMAATVPSPVSRRGALFTSSSRRKRSRIGTARRQVP
jgi:hypothetical protein